jgi:transposase
MPRASPREFREDGIRMSFAMPQADQLLEQENEVLRRAAAYLSQANLPGN